jgi:hypothetical protein
MQGAILRPEQVRRCRGDDLTALIQQHRLIEVAALCFFPREHMIEIVQTLDS